MTTRCVSPQLDFSTVRLSEWVLTSLKTLECSNAHSTLDTDTRRDRDAPLRSLFSALTSVAFGRRRRRCRCCQCGAVRCSARTSLDFKLHSALLVAGHVFEVLSRAPTICALCSAVPLHVRHSTVHTAHRRKRTNERTNAECALLGCVCRPPSA